MTRGPSFSRWLKPVNRVVIALNRYGLAAGTHHVLSVPGRKSGKLYSTPVSLLTMGGERYVTSVGDTGWVKNARVSGWGMLARGRREEWVRLTELPVEERAPVLREFPVQVPAGVGFFRRTHGVSADPEEFAALAPKCPVFRVDGRKPPPGEVDARSGG